MYRRLNLLSDPVLFVGELLDYDVSLKDKLLPTLSSLIGDSSLTATPAIVRALERRRREYPEDFEAAGSLVISACPKGCGTIAVGDEEIAALFGVKTRDKRGQIVPQSWCYECRREHTRSRRKKSDLEEE
jgi:hypothetical protein